MIVFLYALTAFWGAAQVVSTENVFLNSLFTLAFAATVTVWVSTDAKVRHKNLLHIVQTIVFITWFPAIVVYLVATRQLRGVGLCVLHTIGLLTLFAVTYVGTAVLLYSIGWIDLENMD